MRSHGLRQLIDDKSVPTGFLQVDSRNMLLGLVQVVRTSCNKSAIITSCNKMKLTSLLVKFITNKS